MLPVSSTAFVSGGVGLALLRNVIVANTHVHVWQVRHTCTIVGYGLRWYRFCDFRAKIVEWK